MLKEMTKMLVEENLDSFNIAFDSQESTINITVKAHVFLLDGKKQDLSNSFKVSLEGIEQAIDPDSFVFEHLVGKIKKVRNDFYEDTKNRRVKN